MHTAPDPAPEAPTAAGSASAAAIVLRALLYALAIIALIVFTPLGEHKFVYLGF